MVKFKKEGVLLNKTTLDFENEGVLNPAVICEGDNIHLFYRAVSNGNYSSIGYCRLDGPLSMAERYDHPLIISEFDYESHGIEDPRIVRIDDLYYLTYTAYNGVNAQGALAVSHDLKHFEKKGIIVPKISYAQFLALVESPGSIYEKYYLNQTFYHNPLAPPELSKLWDKDVLFFPRRIQGKLAFLHRIRPGIQIVKIDNLAELTDEFWVHYIKNLHDYIVMDTVYPYGNCYIGGGSPPVETARGWLLIYHRAEVTPLKTIYSASAVLLDLDDPFKVLARLPYALIEPELDYELVGEVNNVIFPTGSVLIGDTLYIYYGAADLCIAVASISLSELLNELNLYKI
jgi:beta-1,2-mannobiose phosphorylase / 1,2-beta-oligomannan phosphorylase